jgi:hypothetical protein
MNKKLSANINIIFIVSLLFMACVHAQEKQTDSFWKDVHYGGGIGLSFGNGFFSATLAPTAIYEFNDQFGLGLGLNGTINNQKNQYNSTILGGSLVGLFNPINGLQLSAEFEQLQVNRKFDSLLNLKNDTYWSPALFVGAGFRNGNVTLGMRYDILYDREKSIYADPWAPFVRLYF